MSWFNYIGLIIVAVIMIPNIIYGIKKTAPSNEGIKKPFVILENIGRYGCLFFLIFNIPYTWTNFFFEGGFMIYIIVNSILLVFYLLFFIVFWNKKGVVKALLLSIIPSVMFIFSGVMIGSIPLFLCAIIFAVCHTYISTINGMKVDF